MLYYIIRETEPRNPKIAYAIQEVYNEDLPEFERYNRDIIVSRYSKEKYAQDELKYLNEGNAILINQNQ
jgi:hypothetical protein